MFKKGTWKSVAFEIPIVSICGFEKNDNLNLDIEKVSCSVFSNSLCLQKRRYDGSEDTNSNTFFNAIPIQNKDQVYSYKHLLLAISELYSALKPDLVVLIDHDFDSEVRVDLKVFYTSLSGLISESLMPLGKRKYPLSALRDADFIVVNEVESFSQIHDLIELGSIASSQVIVLDIQKKLDISDDEIRIVSDHDNFGRILSESLRINILTNQA